MIKNFLKIAWRKMLRQRRITVINLIGLSLGITAALILFIIVQHESSYDRHHTNYDHVYRVVTHTRHEDNLDYNAGSSFPLPNSLRLDIPQLDAVVPVFDVHAQIDVPSNHANNADNKFLEQLLFTTNDFFRLFDVSWLAGDSSALNAPNKVVLDRETAIRFFGSWQEAVGKTIKIDNVVNVEIVGIVEDAPSNTNFPLHILGSLSTVENNASIFNYNKDDWNSRHSTFQIFALLDSPSSLPNISKQLEESSKKYFTGRGQSIRTLHLQPLKDLHFDTRYGGTFNEKMIKRSTLTTMSLIGVLILAMAAINFINLSTAQSLSEGKEVGIRKVLGSSRSRLISQSLGETGLLMIVSIIIALILANLLLPYLQYIANVPQNIKLPWGSVTLFLLFTTVLMTILSGLYPALILSRFNPISTLKSKVHTSQIGGVPLRKGLVMLQFALAQLLILGTLITVQQMVFMRHVDLGFDKDALYIVHLPTDAESQKRMNAFKQQLLQLPQIKSVSLSNDVPSSQNKWSSNFYFDGITSDENIKFYTFLKFADADYFQNYGLTFAAGHSYAASDTLREAVINEAMVKKLGLTNAQAAIGKQIRIGGSMWLNITGVVHDFTPNSLREETGPMIISTSKKEYYVAGIKLENGAGKNTIEDIKSLFVRLYPEHYMNDHFLDESIAQFYEQEEKLTLVYQVFAALALIIAAIGLYGMVSFMLGQKVKEIGIRKVLGASESSIVLLFSKEFIVSICLAFCVAAPLAYYLMKEWLNDFAYRIEIGIGIFIIVITTTLILALLTIGIKSFKAAIANPVDSLRDE